MRARGPWSPEQTLLVESLRESGATNADAATRFQRELVISEPELQSLIDSGVIREASRDRYYVHEPSVALSRKTRLSERLHEGFSEPGATHPFTRHRLLKMMIFWLIVILIPIVLIQILGRSR